VRSAVLAIRERGCTAIGSLIALAFVCGFGIGDAKASQGCTAINQGQWNISANNNASNQVDGIFAGGDSIGFTLTGFGEYSFTQALSGGGGGQVEDPETTVTFTASSGEGFLTISSEEGAPVQVQSASCTPGPAPTVTSVALSKGPTTGLNQVVITGTNFSGDNEDQVNFGGNGSCCQPSFSGTTQLTVLAPGGTGTVDVTVTNNGGTSATSPADHYTYLLPLSSDFNGDGVSDILWRDGNGNVAIWLMNGGQMSSGAAVADVGSTWRIVGTRDLDGDGKDDILWQDNSGNAAIWIMNGTTFSSSISLGNVGSDWQVTGTGYFIDRPTGDILWRNSSTGAMAMWPMESAPDAGTVIPGEVVNYGQISLDWQVVGTADLNADGTTDILWRNTTTGDVAIWFLTNNEGQFQILSTVDLGAVSLNWSVVGTGDFNGDDNSDILWRNNLTGDLAVWLMKNGALLSSGDMGLVPLNWAVAAVGDYNGDGKSDILWHCTTGGGSCNAGDLAVWLMNGTSVSSSISSGNVGTSWQVQSVNAGN
jgi:hypothetical protein